MKTIENVISPAKALADKQRKYDFLHHKKRIFDLEGKELNGEKLNSLERTLLRNSKVIVQQSVLVDGYNSVDLSESEYLSELDAFANHCAP